MQQKFPEPRRLTLDADDLTHRWSRQSPFNSFEYSIASINNCIQLQFNHCKTNCCLNWFWCLMTMIGLYDFNDCNEILILVIVFNDSYDCKHCKTSCCLICIWGFIAMIEVNDFNGVVIARIAIIAKQAVVWSVSRAWSSWQWLHSMIPMIVLRFWLQWLCSMNAMKIWLQWRQ